MLDRIRLETVSVITFSKDLGLAKKEIDEIIKDANETILLKGIPKNLVQEGAEIKQWRIEGKDLVLNIESGMHVRSYIAILRLKKLFSSLLGKQFKIGIRKIIANKITFRIPLVTEPPESSLKKLETSPFVKSLKIENNILIIALNEMKEHELQRNVPDRVFSEIREILEKEEEQISTKEYLPIVKKSEPKKIKFSEEPMEVALKIGWVKEFPGKGQWTYTTPYAQLFEIIRELLITEIANNLGFQPFMLPKMIPLEVMKKMPGYLEDIPEGMYYVFPPPRDPEAFKNFKEKFKVTKEIPKKELKKALKDPEYVLAPAQCEPFWQFYGGEIFDIDDLPYKLYDCSGWTYRWEGGGVEGMVRLHEFQRIELTYLGTPEQIIQIRDNVLKESLRVADKILDMEWRITAAIPFWAKEGSVDFDVNDSKNVAAYDLEIYLPYRGDRESSEWLEIAGCFIHKSKFIDSFKIREIKKRELWTGCTGLGITRWIAAFLATNGFDPDIWPSKIREKFKKDYKLPKALLWPKKSEKME
ncbi:aminoacyl--tRNA ligase-related protein [[Eubacterium] cellulosolvens]